MKQADMSNYPLTVADFVCEYLSDPNCRPDLYISGEKLSDSEKADFIQRIRDHRAAKNKHTYHNDTPSLDAPWFAHQ